MDGLNTSDVFINMVYKNSSSFFTDNGNAEVLAAAGGLILNGTSSQSTNINLSGVATKSEGGSVFEGKLIIPLYIFIFVLSVVGNSLVLITLIQNKRMRTVTNVYLLNLALSDLLLGVFCMPFTLVGQVLRNFIFGAAMCKLIPYFQAVAVSVGVWTLVAISLERYFAICRPLKSRRWQTQFHAYKMIVMVWLSSLVWSSPVLAVSSLKAMKGRGFKCREVWPSQSSEQAYNLFLDVTLLLVPLIFMGLAYSLIMSKLWKGMQREIQHNSSCQQQRQLLERASSSGTLNEVYTKNGLLNASAASLKQHRLAPPSNSTQNRANTRSPSAASEKTSLTTPTTGSSKRASTTVKWWIFKSLKVQIPHSKNGVHKQIQTKTTVVPRCELTPCIEDSAACSNNSGNNGREVEEEEREAYTFSRHAIRSNYMDKSIQAKRKVIRMLFVIVAEFFICWAPLHILNTWYLFYPDSVYKYVGSTGISLVQLLAYISSCCNPITYCFMNRKFRQAFLSVFNCYSCSDCFCCCCCEEKADGKLGSARKGNVKRKGILKVNQNVSDLSGNDSTIYAGRASTLGRSEVVVLEAEERV